MTEPMGLLPTSSPRGPAGDRWVTPDTVRGDQLFVRLPRRRGAVRRQSLPGRPAATLPRAGPEVTCWSGPPAGARRERASGGGQEGPFSGDVGVGVAEVVLDGALRDAERAAHADGGELAGVHEAVHGHLRDAHHRGDLGDGQEGDGGAGQDRKSTRLNSSHANNSYAVFILKTKKSEEHTS